MFEQRKFDRCLQEQAGQLNAVGHEGADRAITASLESIRSELQLRAVAVVWMAADGSRCVTTHGATAPDCTVPDPDKLTFPFPAIPSLIESGAEKGIVALSREDQMPDPMRAALSSIDSTHAVLVPYYIGTTPRGFIAYCGSDDSHLGEGLDASGLHFFGAAIHGLIRRQQSALKAVDAQQRIDQLMNQTREGVACFSFSPPLRVSRHDNLNQQLRKARVEEASLLFAKLLGYERREDIIGRPMMDVLGGNMPSWFGDSLGYAFQDQSFGAIERVVTVPGDGVEKHIRFRMQGIFEDGLLSQVWLNTSDVTEAVGARRELEVSERKTRVAVKAAELNTFTVDFRTGEMDLDFTGEPSLGSTGLPETFSDGLEWILTSDRERVLQTWVAYQAGEMDALDLEFRVHAGGEVRWMQILGAESERDADGNVVKMTAVFMDVTERRALDSRLRSAQKLDSLGAFAGGVAHDFNNLLMSVLGFAELAGDFARKGDTDRIQSALDEIRSAASRAADLSRSLQAYAGDTPFEAHPIDLADVAREVIGVLPSSLRGDAQLAMVDAAFGRAWVEGDRPQIQDVLVNLILNAADSLRESGGRVSVRIAVEQLGETELSRMVLGELRTPGEWSVVEVEDDGKGLSPEAVDRLFDPFFTNNVSGRGLGMAAVLGAVRAHGGAIEVNSTEDFGTTTRVALPRVDAPLTEVPAESRGRPESLAGTVLVVDDEAGVRAVVSEMLQALGARTIEASGGEEALELFHQHGDAIRAVLLDLAMPGMDGAAVARRLRAMDPSLPILVSSGFTHRNLPEDLRVPGIRFLQKPYSLARVRSAIADLLD